MSYNNPLPRLNIVLMAGPAVPVLGDFMLYAIVPLTKPTDLAADDAQNFRPGACSCKFRRISPRDGRAAVAAAVSFSGLAIPVVPVAGSRDQLNDPEVQSGQLHGAVPSNTYQRIPGSGHMVYQTDVTAVLRAVTETSCARRSDHPAHARRLGGALRFCSNQDPKELRSL